VTIRRNFVLKALLKHNYFPMQKERKEEIPPVFTSSGITKVICEQVNNVTLSSGRRKSGFDSVQYHSTRYNNVPRLLSIPHPRAYIDICLDIYKNWKRINHICSNSNSLIRPRKHSDGRTIIMDYETSLARRSRYYKFAFGRKFLAHTDISNFFPSLYSHAIPWALVGINQAKRWKASSHWFNKIDKSLRSCSRNETSGIPIGPTVSNIVSEIILERIDRKLRKNFSYVRFIDDYTAFCKTYNEAEEFIRILSIELMKYKLNLNIKKTEIKSLPQAIDEDWVGRMREIIPKAKVINSSQVSNILDTAVRLQKNNPDGSILKYAANSIAPKVNDRSAVEFCMYIIRLCFHYPVLIPTLNNPLNNVYKIGYGNYRKEFHFLLNESIRYGRSDAVSWLLYYVKRFHNNIPSRISDRIVKWGDCFAITLLAEFPGRQKKVVDFAKKLNKNDLYELDNYWLLLYQLYLKRKIRNPYQDDVFKVLRKNGVSFVKLI